MYNNENYGWVRDKNLPVGELTNPYIRREYTASPELMAMMLDYYEYTGDETFLQKTLLPVSDSLLEFWEKHYQT
jgi:alpha-L-fucosidase 2